MENRTVISPTDFVTMPWKNGLGSTVEILKHNVSGSDQFAWRLSMADVTTDGPFSEFKGYDRTLLLLEGRGITLSHSSGHMDLLDTPLQAAKFRGDAETIATLLDGPIKDFNIMALRSHCTAQVIAHPSGDEKTFCTEADLLLLYAVSNDVSIIDSTGHQFDVNGRHLLIFHPTNPEKIVCSGGAFIAIQISYH